MSTGITCFYLRSHMPRIFGICAIFDRCALSPPPPSNGSFCSGVLRHLFSSMHTGFRYPLFIPASWWEHVFSSSSCRWLFYLNEALYALAPHHRHHRICTYFISLARSLALFFHLHRRFSTLAAGWSLACRWDRVLFASHPFVLPSFDCLCPFTLLWLFEGITVWPRGVAGMCLAL